MRRAALLCLLVPLLLLRPPMSAAGRDPFIQEFLAGANGDSRIQFIVINQDTAGQNLWGPNGSAQSRGMLVFYDAIGRETGTFKFVANPPTGGTLKTLIATAEFAALAGAPTPDVIMPPMLNAISGQVCFRNNPATVGFNRNECVSYGAFTGSTGTNTGDLDGSTVAGVPAAPSGLPIVDTISLRRSIDTGRNSDFELASTPTPTNINGATMTMVVATSIAQGEVLFNNETFQGNGRTCASCHGAGTLFRLTPADVQSRFAALSTTFDPLFVGELAPSAFDAGFDGNLNVLTLAAAPSNAAPCIGQLRGVITTANGARATVLARVSGTTYLVFGGVTPSLSGTASDTNSCSAIVNSIAPGGLAATAAAAVLGLEAPLRMRRSSDTANFPQGRALLLENIDGFPPTAPVFRKSPHILNVSRTAPFGFSGDIPDLQTFSTGAVTQHFPRTLARLSTGGAPDFRMPTSAELVRLEAFMLAQEFPSGTDPNKFDLDRFATTSAQRRGRAAFFGNQKCSRCHGGLVLANTTVSILGKAIGINAAFNTGVVNLAINRQGADNLPREANGAREFSTPQLFNISNLGPFFHDASVATLDDAVAFYNTGTFNNSPAGIAIGGINVAGQARNDIVAFLSGLTTRPYSLSAGPLRFGSRAPNAGPTAAQTVIVTNSTAATLTFGSPACSVTGPNAGDFLVSSCPLVTPLAPGESRSVQVVFDPAANGDKSAILEFNAAVPSGVDLLGTGGATDVTPTFTDDPLVAGATPIRALHFTEARTYIDALRLRYGLSTVAWTDATIVAGTTTIKAAHLQEMRTALTEIYVAAGRTAPAFSTTAVAGVTGATAAQITEIRAAILAIW